MKSTEFLIEYRRDVTAQKLGDKLLASAKRENITDIDKILATLEDMDPTPNKQYTLWIANQYNKGQFRLEDKPRIKTALERFMQAKSRLQEKDIGKYDFYRLEDEMEKIFNPDVGKQEPQTTDTFEIPAEIKNEVEVLYNGPLGLLAVPKTKKASCILGSGTRWCTAGREDNMFSDYNKQGPLYIWRDKNGEKYQFHFGKEEFQFMDSKDREISKTKLKDFRTKHPILKKLFDNIVKNLIDNKKAMQLAAYADFFRKRMPEAENIIAKNAAAAVEYATHIIQDRWPLAEKTIIKSPKEIVNYARYVIHDRWPEAEHIVLKDPFAAREYAEFIIRDRWPLAEKVIAKSPWDAYIYAMHIIEGRWPEAEKYIMKDPVSAVGYADNILHKRWKEAEPMIAKSIYAYDYANDVIGDRFEMAEPYIMKDPQHAFYYARDILEERWPAAEKYIKKDANMWAEYLYHFRSYISLAYDELREAKTKTTKKPKGDCFAVAARAMIAPFSPDLKLVHAYVSGQGPLKGKRFSHAWNEIGDVVFDNSNGNNLILRKEQYYKLGEIVTEPGQYQVYDPISAKKMMLQTKHYGPWELDPAHERI
jgi:hypothetical protein